MNKKTCQIYLFNSLCLFEKYDYPKILCPLLNIQIHVSSYTCTHTSLSIKEFQVRASSTLLKKMAHSNVCEYHSMRKQKEYYSVIYNSVIVIIIRFIFIYQ